MDEENVFRSGDSNYMVSLARGLHVLQIFSEAGRQNLSVAEVTGLSGLSRSSVVRCLYTLQELGFVARDGRRYYLLPKVLKLGHGYVSTASLPIQAQPQLDALTARTDSATAIVVLDGEDVLYIARAVPSSSSNVVSINLNIGNRRPAYITASGQVLLASLDANAVQDYLDGLDNEQVLENSGRTIDEFAELIERARHDDHAFTRLVFAKSMSAVAVPVRNVIGTVVASIVIAVYDESSNDEEIVQRHLPGLKAAAQQLGEKLIE